MSLMLPIVVIFVPFGKESIRLQTLWILALTTVISVFAFYTAENLIVRFKDTLAAKGLFGKDLNKAGDRETKEKV